MEFKNLEIHSLITAIRDSLDKVDDEMQRASRETLFELDTLEIELKCVATESKEKKGGIDLKVISASATGQVKAESVQTIKIRYSVTSKAKQNQVSGVRAHSSAQTGQTKDVGRLG